MTCGGFSIGGIHTARDMGFTMSAREVGAPEPKTVRKTVPFMNGSYDFSKVYGRLFFGDRELSYSFDIAADTPREVDAEIARLLNFAAFCNDAEIRDDDSPHRHFKGSYAGAEIEYDETGLAATVTVTFSAYPFRIADDESVARVEVGDNIVRNPGYPVRFKVIPDGTMTIQIGALRQTYYGETLADMRLESGENVVKVTEGGGVLKWREEVV